jgi:hypothetical protein
MIALRKMSVAAVRNSAKQSTRLIKPRATSLSRFSHHRVASVNMLAGMLPQANLPTIGQWMLRAIPCTKLPPVLVAAA